MKGKQTVVRLLLGCLLDNNWEVDCVSRPTLSSALDIHLASLMRMKESARKVVALGTPLARRHTELLLGVSVSTVTAETLLSFHGDGTGLGTVVGRHLRHVQKCTNSTRL